MRRLSLALALALLLAGCAGARAPLALVTPGPPQQTRIRGLFRGEDEPAEVVELDAEHGHWAYRSDALGIRIDVREGEYGGGTALWCAAEIAWRGGDPLEIWDMDAPLEPEALAASAGSLLFMPCTERAELVVGGEAVAADGARRQRSGYGRRADGGYVAFAVTGSFEGDSLGLTAEELAALFIAEGCDYAVQLAEGPAAAMLFMGLSVNDPLETGAQAAPGGAGWGKRDAIAEKDIRE
ncbi:MAG: phosphodiester glycosidase family protein [Clostridia bacterium]|nr:phosphodiester glycosidase family protein [Clostridia bacterium]